MNSSTKKHDSAARKIVKRQDNYFKKKEEHSKRSSQYYEKYKIDWSMKNEKSGFFEKAKVPLGSLTRSQLHRNVIYFDKKAKNGWRRYYELHEFVLDVYNKLLGDFSTMKNDASKEDLELFVKMIFRVMEQATRSELPYKPEYE